MKNSMVLILLFYCGSGSAAPVVWELQNITFDDGGNATGSFVYDADTNQVSNIEITTSDGTTPFFLGSDGETDYYETFSGASYISAFYNPLQAGRYNFYTQPNPEVESPYTLAVQFTSELEDDSSVYPVLTGFGESSDDLERYIVSGQIISSRHVDAVPVPSAIWSLGSAIAVLGWLRRKKTASFKA